MDLSIITTKIFSSEILTAITIIFGFCVATLTDQWQLIKKVQGGLSLKIASGYNSAMKMMVINRFGAVIYFSASAYFIETKSSTDELILIYVVSLLSALIFIILMSKYYVDNSVLTSDFFTFKKMTSTSFFANTFSALGLTLPLIAGTIFLDYRLLLSNASFFFNTIYTFIMVFYIEAKIANLIDKSSSDLRSTAFSIIFGRIMAYLFVCILYILILMNAK